MHPLDGLLKMTPDQIEKIIMDCCDWDIIANLMPGQTALDARAEHIGVSKPRTERVRKAFVQGFDVAELVHRLNAIPSVR